MTLLKGKHPIVKGHLAIVNQNRIVEKTLSKNSKKVVKEREISSGILKTTTIEHTWIQRDSNFVSLRGLESHLNL